MGRDVTGLRIDKKASEKSNYSARATIHVAPEASPAKTGNARLPVAVNKKMITPTRIKLGSPENGAIHADHVNGGGKEDDSGVNVLSKLGDLDSPDSGKKSQLPKINTQFVSGKQLYDEEDNWSLASSTATSIRTKITVPVAPRFSCVDRLQRRKEFYTRLEEKHKALEKEKLEYEARIMEEEQAAKKQMRKSMVVKANPVPSFYHEGPPPQPELKKFPVTRAKSPNLTRRKSCSDAAKPPSPVDKGRAGRHSVGPSKQGKAAPFPASSPHTPKSKDGAKGPDKVKNQQPNDAAPSAEESPATE